MVLMLSLLAHLTLVNLLEGHGTWYRNPTITENNIGHPILADQLAPQLLDAVSRILSETHKASKKCGIYATGGKQAKQFAQQRFDMTSVATEHTALDGVLRVQFSIASGVAKPGRGVTY